MSIFSRVTLSSLALAAALLGGCMRPNEAHCGNQAGDASCEEPSLPFCNLCAIENDGCVALPVADPSCAAPSRATVVTDTDTDTDADTNPDAATSTTVTTSAGTTTSSETDLDAETSADTTEGDGSTGTTSDSSSTSSAPEFCGDDEKNGQEPCDGEDFGEKTCEDYYFSGGALVCTPQCEIDITGCCLGPGSPCNLLNPKCCDGLTCSLVAMQCL